MKQRGLILSGLLMLVAMLGLLFFAGAIYDAEQKQQIDSFFFQIPSKAANRVNTPIPADSMPDSFLREIIIARFVNEYFYVIPDAKNAELRTNSELPRNTDGTVTPMGFLPIYKSIYDKWLQNVAPEIVNMAEQKMLRTVRIFPGFTMSDSGHLIVKYELTTWTKPNDVLALPEVTQGELYMDVTKEPVHMESPQKVLYRLQTQKLEPVAAFNFYILDVIQN